MSVNSYDRPLFDVNAYGVTLGTFYSSWMNENTLDDCVRYSCRKSLAWPLNQAVKIDLFTTVTPTPRIYGCRSITRLSYVH